MLTFVAIAAAFGLIVVGLFIGQVVFASFKLRYRSPKLVRGNPTDLEWHIIVPALNEASVIETTLSELSKLTPRCHVWVVNDDSDDGTEDIVDAIAEDDPWVRLINRRQPLARTGKGDALNAAYHQIVEWRTSKKNAKTSMETIVGVVDADGRLSEKTLDVLAGPSGFADLQVGAIQQDVWMRNAFDKAPLPKKSELSNRFSSLLLTLQDLEFRAAVAGIQNGRHQSESVSMGGNGQWTRLATLDELATLDAEKNSSGKGVPWHGALLEDFELGLHILLAGWKTIFLPGLWVSQEALPTVRSYVRQRTRWTQGTMQCMRYLPRLWNGKFIGPWTLLETLYYLLQPWLWIVGTILFPIPLYEVARSFVASPSLWMRWITQSGGWMWVAMFWFIAVGPLTSWGFTYRKVLTKPGPASWKKDENGDEVLVYEKGSGGTLKRSSALKYGFAYVWLIQVSYLIAWKALFRLLTRRSGWVKTARNTEISAGLNVDVETQKPQPIT